MSQMSYADSQLETALTAMFERKVTENRSTMRYWPAVSDRLGEQVSRRPWEYVMDALNRPRVPFNSRYIYAAGSVLVIVIALLLLVLLLNTDDGADGESIPAAPAESRSGVEEVIALTATIGARPIFGAQWEEREHVVAFLNAISDAAGPYMSGLSRGRGAYSALSLFGTGQIAEGLLNWSASLDQLEQAVLQIEAPDGIEGAQAIKSYGLGVLQSHRDWIEGVRADLLAGSFIDTVLLVKAVEELFQTDEHNRWVGMRDELRAMYFIRWDDIQRACIGAGYVACF